MCVFVVVVWAAAGHSDEVHVDDFGALGNGIAIDDQAIKLAIMAAGQNGTVIFTAGKTYNVQSKLVPLNGQTWQGNGATIRRANELKTFLSQDARAGDNFVYVQDPSTFTLGMSVTPVRGAGGVDDIEYAGNYSIIQIDGNKLVLARPLIRSYTAGGPVVNYFDQIGGYTGSDTLAIENFRFDGNRSQNNTLTAWSRNRAVVTQSNTQVTGNYFADLPGDGIAAFGEKLNIEQNSFQNGNTSGIHLSGNFYDEDVVIRQNVFYRLNEQAALAGHSEGAITISQAANHVRILQNFVFDTDTAFIAGFHASMGDWTVQHNQVAQTAALFYGGSTSVNPLHDIHWLDNWVQDAGNGTLSTSNNESLIQNFIFTGNHILDGSIELSGLNQSLVSQNFISSPGESTLDVSSSFATMVSDNQLVPNFSNGHTEGSVYLKYNHATGNASLRGSLSSFALVTDGRALTFDLGELQLPFVDFDFNQLVLPFAIAQWDADFVGLSGEFQLGQILPAHLSRQQLSEMLVIRHYVNHEESFGELGLSIVPEPNLSLPVGLALLGLVAITYVRRRRISSSRKTRCRLL